jgi:hypothetical protein
MHRVTVAALMLAVMAFPAAASAESPALRSGLTAYSAQGVKTNLPDFLGHVIDGTLDFEDAHFEGFGYRHGTTTPAFLDKAARFVRLDGLATGVELIGVKHRGVQDHVETAVAYSISTPQARLVGVRARLGWSIGVSHAFEKPTYDRTGDGKQRRTLSYMAYELELGLQRFEHVSLVARVHHRSGAYGLFAPEGTGSNFVAMGVRVHW